MIRLKIYDKERKKCLTVQHTPKLTEHKSKFRLINCSLKMDSQLIMLAIIKFSSILVDLSANSTPRVQVRERNQHTQIKNKAIMTSE